MRAALSAWGNAELTETAELLASEVVTNAVLHAGTDIEVRARALPPGVRIEVRDGSHTLPGLRNYDDSATTGRGLGLLDALASSWGVEATRNGKVVWFDVGAPPSAAKPPRGCGSPPAEHDDAPPPGTVRLLRLPVELVRATLEYGDTVVRELMLLSMAGEIDGDLAPIYTTPEVDLTDILEAVESARAEGRSEIDLRLERPIADGDRALERLAAVEEADRLAREDRLLTPAAVPEIGECRRWLMGQIALQLAGGAAAPWELGAALATDAPWEPLDTDGRRAVLDGETSVLAADSSNRITFVAAAVARLLGWHPDELLGRRLTTIIPPSLREAHLAGFTRFHVTGETRVLGQPVRLPALRSDGSEVEVELLIEAVRLPSGTPALRAVITPAE